MYRLLITFICLSFIGCLSDDECFTQEVEIQSIEKTYGCEDSHIKLKIKGDKDLYLIKNQQDFSKFIESDCEIDIDFEKFDLIIGRNFQFIPREVVLYKTCSNQFVLQVSKDENSNAEDRLYVYHALVSKGILNSVDNIIVSLVNK